MGCLPTYNFSLALINNVPETNENALQNISKLEN